MKVKSVQHLRRWLVQTKEGIENINDSNYNPDFIGYRSNHAGKFGLFKAYHGDKKDEGAFIFSTLKMASDGQAIYEFIQNAADCGSDMFSIFYDENFFLALNNGKPFSTSDIDSILNIGQGTKVDNCQKIGRFGIGFKLVHRLVGKNEGLAELKQQYKGPTIFTWSKPEHFTSLLETNSVHDIKYEHDLEGDAPWLFKILMTNFPTQPNEEVRDLNYENQILFPISEFDDLVGFIKKYEGHIDLERLHQGSLFFLKLGEGKKRLLDKHYEEDLKNGVQYSLNMLKTLRRVVINDDKIDEITLNKVSFTISVGSTYFNKIGLEDKDKECDVHILFGYLPHQEHRQLVGYSNFYKYFPMGDEEQGLKFIIHCNVFDINASRRELHESTINIEIFHYLVEELKKYLEDAKTVEVEAFLEIYANLLLSKQPKISKGWLLESLYEPLMAYIKVNIPTQSLGQFYSKKNVIVKGTSLHITPTEFGIPNIEWFYWQQPETDLVEAAKTKLELKVWQIADLIEVGSAEHIYQWVLQANPETYKAFLRELNSIDPRRWENLLDNFCRLRIFNFTDGGYYSVDELIRKADSLLIFGKINHIKRELWQKLGLIVSGVNISNYDKLEAQIKTRFQKFEFRVFERVAARTQNPSLTVSEKQNLFNFLRGLEGVGLQTLKGLILFNNRSGTPQPLGELIGNIQYLPPVWLIPYQIDLKEYYRDLDSYLLPDSGIYDTIIYPRWESIIQQVAGGNKVAEFYQYVIRYHDISKDKSLLTSHAYIFTDDGFKKIENVFYSKHLADTQSYAELKIAIEALTNLSIPEKTILEYLSQQPFKTDSDKLEDCMRSVGKDSADLPQPAVKHLMQFINKNGESFFTFLYVSKTINQGIYLVSYNRSVNVSQYYADKVKLQSYIQKHLSTLFQLLPTELYNERANNTGLLKGEDLYQELLRNHFSEDLIGVVKESGITDVELAFLKLIPSLTLVQGQVYEKNSYHYQILNLACQHLMDNSLCKHLRSRITIVDRKCRNYAVADVANNNDVIFDLEDKEYRLRLSDILPSHQGTADILEEVMQGFESLALRLKTLFDVGTQRNHDDVYAELKRDYPHLENASQLAFVVLYAKSQDGIDLLEGFTVGTSND